MLSKRIRHALDTGNYNEFDLETWAHEAGKLEDKIQWLQERVWERKINCIHCAREMILTEEGIKLLPVDEHGKIKFEFDEDA